MLVERFELVSAFRRDPAVCLTKGPQLQSLANQLKGQILNVNTPEHAPPELPRLVLRFDKAVFQVGLNRFQLIIQPATHVAGSFGEALAFAKNLAKPVMNDLFEGGEPQFEWTGVVATLNFPADRNRIPNAIEASKPLVRNLTTLDWPLDELATFELKVGRRHDEFFRNYSVSGYEARELQLEVRAGAPPVEVPLETIPILEAGITVTLDVNSRPSPVRNNPWQDLERTTTELSRAYSTLAEDLKLTGVI